SRNYLAASEFYTLSLHDALPISARCRWRPRVPTTSFTCISSGRTTPRLWRLRVCPCAPRRSAYCVPCPPTSNLPKRVCRCGGCRSEEHTSELQSRFDLVCRLLLE